MLLQWIVKELVHLVDLSQYKVEYQLLNSIVHTHTHTHTHTHIYIYIYICVCVCVCSCVFAPGSSVGIATELRAGQSGIETRWRRNFPPFQTGPGAHPASFKMGTGSFPGVKCGRGVLLTTHHLLVLRSWKSRAIPLTTLM